MSAGLSFVFACGAPQSAQLGDVVERFGMCDASAAVCFEDGTMLVANDEDNLLRLYASQAEAPLATFDLTPHLAPDDRHPEADLEAAATVGERVYWITSHGANRSGKRRPSRRRFFATRRTSEGGVSPVGSAYSRLLQDLVADERYERFDLEEAARRAPKSRGGLNIEGLGARDDGSLLIGFRNPLYDGKALLVPLLDPARLVDEGGPARFGEPILLDFDGRGVRSIAELGDGRFLITAGTADGPADRLFLWDGVAERAPVVLGSLNFNAEALAVDGGRRRILVLSDDGTRRVDGQVCKTIEDPMRRRFRMGELPWPAKPEDRGER